MKQTEVTENSSQRAILLIAHGSRRAEANADLRQLAEMIKHRFPDSIIEYSYLELAEPDIPAGAKACVEKGASEVQMFPYFLSAGTHVQQDLQEFKAQFEAEYPQVQFEVCPHLGLHPMMVDIVIDRLNQSISS